jgi:DNA gyrase subunit A
MENQNNILNTPITKEMKKAYLDYAMSVIVARALPDVRDGLKPVNRRIVYAAHEMNLTFDSSFKKCAAVVGRVMEKYHPHGDVSIYDALVRMGQNFSLRYTLIKGQGNFGTIDGDPPAAMRYTECKLDKISDYLLMDIDKNTVPFGDNYSADAKEPLVLPAVMPNLLMNGTLGIAVGMATNIPPHNLGELVDTLLATFDRGKLKIIEEKQVIIKAYDIIDIPTDVVKWEIENTMQFEDIVKILRGPDFPTGCTIYDQAETLRYFATGKGRIIQRAKTKIEELKNGKFAIVVSEIPYQVNKTSLIEKIADLVNEKKTRDISDIKDLSRGEGIEIQIELKKDARPQKVLNYLYKYTQLQSTFNANMLALVNGDPRVLSIKEFLDEFIKHRRDVITNRTLYLLQKAREREHILEGLKKALDIIDEIIAVIKKSKDSEIARTNLIKSFGFTEIQAQAILDMQLRRLAALEREKIENELKEIQKNIKTYNLILAKPEKMIELIRGELEEIKEKFADARKTKVIKGGVGELEDEDIIANENTLITVTETGYIKRMSPSTYKTQSRGGKGVSGMKTKEEDEVSMLRFADTHDRLFFITNKGKLYERKVWDIPESSRTSKGTAIVNIIDISTDERVEEILTIGKEIEANKKNLFIFFATKDGNIKKTLLSEYENIRKSGIIAIGLKDTDALVRAQLTNGNNEVILVTENGKSIRFNETDVREMGRSASGVKGIALKMDDHVVSMEIVPEDTKGSRLLCIMQNGYGKATEISEYGKQNRGGSGLLVAKVTPKTGKIVSVKMIDDTIEDIILTSESAQVIRIPATSIPRSSRTTQGVILMRMKDGDKVSAVSTIQKIDEEPKAS